MSEQKPAHRRRLQAVQAAQPQPPEEPAIEQSRQTQPAQAAQRRAKRPAQQRETTPGQAAQSAPKQTAQRSAERPARRTEETAAGQAAQSALKQTAQRGAKRPARRTEETAGQAAQSAPKQAAQRSAERPARRTEQTAAGQAAQRKPAPAAQRSPERPARQTEKAAAGQAAQRMPAPAAQCFEEPAAREPEAPVRIIAAPQEQPEWMAGSVEGAAERRLKKQEPAAHHSAAGKDKPSAQTPSAAQPAAEKPRPAQPKKPAAPAKKPAPRKLTKKERERRARQIRRIGLSALGAAVLAALAAVAVIFGGRLVDMKQTLDSGDGVFYHNIFVNDIPLEGLSLDEAAYTVSKQVSEKVSAWKITLRTQDGQSWDITSTDLNMKYDVADQLDQLWAIGHIGSSSERYERVKKLEENPEMRYTTLSYDMTSVTQILNQIKDEVYRPAVNATRVEDKTVWPPYAYTDDIPGQELDISGFNERICDMANRLESGVVDLTPTTVPADITREYLEGRIVELSSYDTTVGATSEPGRFINIEVGTKKFNHLIIMPRESVSFNKVAGRRIYENGYADAPELAYGDYRTGVGGGICQVSSTLYNAVVNAGLQVDQRTQHSLASSYVPLGLDATVQDDRLDFVFTNNTGEEIFISSEYYKRGNYYHCRFTIHGRPDPHGYTYKLESQVVEELPIPEPTYIPDTEAQYVIYDDETKETFKGEEGYIVDVYKVTMDENGVEVARELDHTDTYNTRQPRVYVGITPRETPVPYDYYGY